MFTLGSQEMVAGTSDIKTTELFARPRNPRATWFDMHYNHRGL